MLHFLGENACDINAVKHRKRPTVSLVTRCVHIAHDKRRYNDHLRVR